jgi:RNA polymerase sigma factor (sigma-70 family)
VTPTEALRDHKGLVFLHVGRWMRRHPSLRSYREDLIQDGIEGLLQAATTYKPGKGVAFSTWAYNYIFDATRAGASKYVGLTSRASSSQTGVNMVVARANWRPDRLATDPDGVPLTPDALVGAARTPEDLAAAAELAGRFHRYLTHLRRELSPRDLDIYTQYIAMDRTTKDTPASQGNRRLAEPGSLPVLAAKYGISKQRVEQIVRAVEARVRKWGAGIKAEAA